MSSRHGSERSRTFAIARRFGMMRKIQFTRREFASHVHRSILVNACAACGAAHGREDSAAARAIPGTNTSASRSARFKSLLAFGVFSTVLSMEPSPG